MKSKKYLLILTVAFGLFNSGCGKYDSTPHESQDLGEQSPPSDTGDLNDMNQFVCYLKSCFRTLDAQKIIDPKKDYKYLDPNLLTDVSLRPFYQPPHTFLDLSTIEPNSKVAPNFLFKDFMSPSKGRYGLFSSDVVTKIQLIRNFIGKSVVINSGYRSPGYNDNTPGSANWSRHMYGDGVDFYVPTLKITDLPALCKKFNSSFELVYTAHVHCDWRKTKGDPAFFKSINTQPSFVEPMTVAQAISQDSAIQVLRSQNTLKLAAALALTEDELNEGALVYEWQITLPNGTVQNSASAIVEVPLMKGAYSARLMAGGSIHLEKSFSW